MKELKDTIASAVAAASADTVNAEGAPAWTIRDADRLVQLAMTGTLGNAFYASAQEITADAVRLLARAEPRALADAIVRGRNDGFIRAFPLLGLVYLSLKDTALFRETFSKSTSPYSLPSTLFIPASITTTPSFTMSAVIRCFLPTAQTSISACLVIEARSSVLL